MDPQHLSPVCPHTCTCMPGNCIALMQMAPPMRSLCCAGNPVEYIFAAEQTGVLRLVKNGSLLVRLYAGEAVCWGGSHAPG